MQAGRELDVRIARGAFELTVYQATPAGYRVVTGDIDPKYGLYVSAAHDMALLPLFSADIAAAWQVVERMAKLGYWCQVRNEFESHGGPDCWAGFTPHSTTGWNGRPDHWTQAETVPLAICLAALRAVGVTL